MGENGQYCVSVKNLAAASGICESELPLIINGCSGGFSAVYKVAFGRKPSCEDCCDLHDLRYQLGGNAAERKAADRELRRCAVNAGKPIPGWLEDIREKRPRRAALFALVPPLRKAGRFCRAWVMYAAIRLLGGRYWSESE
mgnify:CR=1 FL=1